MRSDVERDLRATISSMKGVVIPSVTKLIGATNWVQVETCERTRLSDSLDISSGIDWTIQLEGSTAQFGVSSRVQWVDRAWSTFTIREKRTSGAATELAKQRDRLEQTGAFVSRFTLQAYCAEPKGKGPLRSVAVCETADLYDYLSGHELVDRRDPRRFTNYWRQINDGSENRDEFFCVPWHHMGEHYWLKWWPYSGPILPERPLGNTMRAAPDGGVEEARILAERSAYFAAHRPPGEPEHYRERYMREAAHFAAKYEEAQAATTRNEPPRPAGNTFASMAVHKLVSEGHDRDAARAAVVAMKGGGPDPLLTPDEVDALRMALGAAPLAGYVAPVYPPAWAPKHDYGRWSEHWGTNLPPVPGGFRPRRLGLSVAPPADDDASQQGLLE